MASIGYVRSFRIHKAVRAYAWRRPLVDAALWGRWQSNNSQEECDETREQSAFCGARFVGMLCRGFRTDIKIGERSAESISVSWHRWSCWWANRVIYDL